MTETARENLFGTRRRRKHETRNRPRIEESCNRGAPSGPLHASSPKSRTADQPPAHPRRRKRTPRLNSRHAISPTAAQDPGRHQARTNANRTQPAPGRLPGAPQRQWQERRPSSPASTQASKTPPGPAGPAPDWPARPRAQNVGAVAQAGVAGRRRARRGKRAVPQGACPHLPLCGSLPFSRSASGASAAGTSAEVKQWSAQLARNSRSLAALAGSPIGSSTRPTDSLRSSARPR